MEWLVVMGLLGVVTMVAAMSRGRTAMWFWAGLLLGPIGLIWVLVLPANEAVLVAEQIDAGRLKKCPFCAESIKTEAKICKHCGKDQPEVPNLQRLSWTCVRCTGISKGTADYCWHCNEPKPKNVKLFDQI